MTPIDRRLQYPWDGERHTRHSAFAIQVSGHFALFTRIDAHGAHPVSYKMPTYSACLGLITTLIGRRNTNVEIIPVAVDALDREPRLVSYAYNNNTPSRKRMSIVAGVPNQIKCLVVSKPKYRVIFELRPKTEDAQRAIGYTIHQLHHAVENGGNASHPFLGTSEFLASVTFATTQRPYSFDEFLPTMSKQPPRKARRAEIYRNVTVKAGRLVFPDQSYPLEESHA